MARIDQRCARRVQSAARISLDGGRVLRALLWAVHHNVDRATRNAARVGQVVAGLFIGWGLLQFFLGAGVGGLWLAFIGWFLMMAAQASYAEVSMGEALRNIRVAEVMADDCVTVDPHLTVQDLVDDILRRTGRRCVLVRSNGRVLGLVTPNEIRNVDRARWSDMRVTDVMRPLEQLRTVTPDTAVSEPAAHRTGLISHSRGGPRPLEPKAAGKADRAASITNHPSSRTNHAANVTNQAASLTNQAANQKNCPAGELIARTWHETSLPITLTSSPNQRTDWVRRVTTDFINRPNADPPDHAGTDACTPAGFPQTQDKVDRAVAG